MWELLSNEQETKKKNNLFVLSFHPDDETSANLQGVPAQDCQLWLDLGLLHQHFFPFLEITLASYLCDRSRLCRLAPPLRNWVEDLRGSATRQTWIYTPHEFFWIFLINSFFTIAHVRLLNGRVVSNDCCCLQARRATKSAQSVAHVWRQFGYCFLSFL